MIDIRWQYDSDASYAEHVPVDASEALGILAQGNASFAGLNPVGSSSLVMNVTLEDLGFGGVPGVAPAQTPFAALLGCADARVPVELIFSQSANDLFVVRVAGNVLGSECVGSLDYALSHLPSVRVFGVVGHTGCGAVSAAVDAYLNPVSYLGLSHNLPLRSIVDAVMAAVRGADRALHLAHGDDVASQPGYRAALVDTAVVVNAAVAADALGRILQPQLREDQGVAFAVFELASRTIGLPADGSSNGWRPGLVPPPTDDALVDFVANVASSSYVSGLLATAPTASH